MICVFVSIYNNKIIIYGICNIYYVLPYESITLLIIYLNIYILYKRSGWIDPADSQRNTNESFNKARPLSLIIIKNLKPLEFFWMGLCHRIRKWNY